MGERQLCKLDVVGSIPSASTTKLMGKCMFKKALLFAVAMLFASGVFAKAGCTAEEFQKEAMAMQAVMTELSKNPEKFAKANAEFEKTYSDEMMEFAKFAQSAAADPAKAQEVLDKGCDLYGRMNKTLNEYK